jgi:glutathione S-transferase
MWARRTDLAIIEPLTNGFRFSDGLALFQSRVHCIPQAADDLKAIAREKLSALDGLISGRTYIAGDKFSLADIHLFVFLDFAAQVGQPLDPANKNLTAWMARIGERPSAAASA